ncbi:MAG TPA: DNA-directed RNA polymerase subunit N [archaeon]|nr:DNA-directed RNA polymerase subunit N [archaeon]
MWEKYKDLVEKGESPKKVLDELGIEKYCCRALFLTHKDLIKDIARFRV